MRVSVVMSNYFKRKFLPYSLHAYDVQTVRPQEVIVVNDDTLPLRLHKGKYGFNLRVISTGRKDNLYRTSSFAMNSGILAASGDVVVISSCETLPGSRNIEYLLDKVRKKTVVYASVFYFQQSRAFMFREVLDRPDLIRHMKVAVWREGRVSKDHEIVRQDNMVNGFFGAHRQRFLDVGGFDADRAFWGGNDQDLNRRFEMAGFEKVFDKRMFGIHLWHRRPPKGHVEEAVRMKRDMGDPEGPVARRGIYGQVPGAVPRPPEEEA